MSDPRPPLDFNPDPVRRAFESMISDPRTRLAESQPQCECKCNGAEPHAAQPCRRPATTLVALHRWGWCTEDPRAATPPLVDPAVCDETGAITALMCNHCTEHAIAVSKAKVRLLLDNPDVWGAHPQCPTCHRHTQAWTDLMQRRPL